MIDPLSKLIENLKEEEVISSQTSLVRTLDNINSYVEEDAVKAYLLGHFFKRKLDSDNLSTECKKYLIDTIKDNKLDSFYYLKEIPESENLGLLFYILAIGGIAAIALGVVQLVNGEFTYGLETKYLLPVIREGGYKIILGIGLLIGGIFSIKHYRRKMKLIKELTH